MLFALNKRVDAGTRIDDHLLQETLWPSKEVSDDVILDRDVIIGAYARNRIEPGFPIREGDIELSLFKQRICRPPGSHCAQPVPLIPSGMRAATLAISESKIPPELKTAPRSSLVALEWHGNEQSTSQTVETLIEETSILAVEHDELSKQFKVTLVVSSEQALTIQEHRENGEFSLRLAPKREDNNQRDQDSAPAKGSGDLK